MPGLVIYQTDALPGLYAFNGTAWGHLGANNLSSHTDPVSIITIKTYGANGLAADRVFSLPPSNSRPPRLPAAVRASFTLP